MSQSSAVHISPSEADSASTTSEEDDLAEQAWQESLDQLTLLFNLVLLPFAGKYFGRKFAYFSMNNFVVDGADALVWARWMEYRWPVEVVFSSKKTFNLAVVAEAALM
jgi:Mitochondrial import 2